MAFTNYSTVDAVRKEAGFEANEDVEASAITDYLNEATAIVQSQISAIYNLSSFDSNFEGSQAQIWLRRVETLFAAGFLLNKEFGVEDDGETGRGDKKIGRAEGMLDLLTFGNLILLDSTGVEYTKVTKKGAGRITGFPLASEAENSDGQDVNRNFSTGDVQ